MLTTDYEVTLTLSEDLLGTVPKNRDVYADYIASKKPENLDEEIETVPEIDENKGWTGFHKDDQGYFLFDYQIKGFLKEAGNILKDQLEVKALRNKIEDFVFVFPRRIRLGEPASEPLERPLRAMTAQGPRVSLVRSDRVESGATLTFELRCLPHAAIKEKLLAALLDYGQFKGLGQWRGGGYGRFTYEIKAR